jgi:hypothetical protein
MVLTAYMGERVVVFFFGRGVEGKIFSAAGALSPKCCGIFCSGHLAGETGSFCMIIKIDPIGTRDYLLPGR